MFDKLKQRFGKANRPVEAAEPPKPPPIIDVTDADFEAVVLRSPLLTVVDFWAEWCQPCQVMSAYVGFLAREYEAECWSPRSTPTNIQRRRLATM